MKEVLKNPPDIIPKSHGNAFQQREAGKRRERQKWQLGRPEIWSQTACVVAEGELPLLLQ